MASPQREGAIDAGPRERLIAAMTDAVAEEGYGRATVAAVVARARTSRRTFYEHFADRDDCFLAAYRALAGELAAGALEATRDLPWPRRLDGVIDGYLGALAARPELARAIVVDVWTAGPEAVRVRRRAMDDLADLFVSLVDDARRDGAAVDPLSPDLALAALGGFEELVLRRVEEGRPETLPELAGDARTIVRRLVGAEG